MSDRYAVERELGKGGMATVYLAKDVRHERDVAIKVLHPELAKSIGGERFLREIKLSAKLQHPNILGLIDSGEADGLLYYVMPFVKGESLRDRLDREGQLPIDDAIQLTLEVADALGFAHGMGIVHRDIKPENILISNGHALVADFGIARAATEAGGQKLTQTGMAVGTPVYMSPEQSVGDQTGPTSDLYSLGCMLYEMLAGEPPFTAKNPQALMARHAMEAVPSIRIIRNTVPEEVEDAIFAAMAKTPADRPQNAQQFAELLGVQLGATASRRAAIRHTSSRRVPTGAVRTYQEQPAWWRKPWVMAAGGLAVAGVAVGGYLFATSRGSGGSSGSAAEVARAKQIAVLYFTPADSSLRDVADGLTESLISSLKTVPGLFVRPSTSVRAYRDRETPKDSIGRALNVGTIVSGSVDPEGRNRVSITASILDGSGANLGRRATVTIPRDSLFLAADSVAGRVALLLRQQLGQEIQLKETEAGTASQTAWTLFQRAEKTRKDADPTVTRDTAQAAVILSEADSLFTQASREDSRWIEPLILRGQIALQLGGVRFGPDPSRRARWLNSGLGLAEQALKLDGRNGKALALRGNLRYQLYGADQNAPDRPALLKSAEQDLLDATAADPSLASAFATLSQLYYAARDKFAAFSAARNAWNADAYLSNAEFILARLFYTAYDTGQPREALKWCDLGAQRFPRNFEFTRCRLWMMTTEGGNPDVDQAWRLASKADSLVPENNRPYASHMHQMLVGGIIGKVAGGKPGPLLDSAKRVLVRARADATIDRNQELPAYEAVMRTQMGDYDEAIRLLTRYVAVNPDHSFWEGDNVHWWWRPIKDKPEFQRLVGQRPH